VLLYQAIKLKKKVKQRLFISPKQIKRVRRLSGNTGGRVLPDYCKLA